MLSLDQPQALQNVNTEIKLTSDHGNWDPKPTTVQSTTFTIAGTGGSIVSQFITDRYTALVTVLGTTAGVQVTITDTVNSEAVSVSVMSAAALQSETTSDGGPASEVGTPGDNAPPPGADVPT